MKRAGIIGGLGPETTAEFYLNVIFSCQKIDTTVRAPLLISSVPMPFKLEEALIERNENPEKIRPFLVEEARRLEKAGADFLVMPCNSLHVFIADIRSAVSIPVLSIIEETTAYIRDKGFKRVGIVSTSATIENKLYETALQKEGIAYETPDALEQARLGKMIHNLVLGQLNNKDREELVLIINNFEKRNVDCVALACTDLQLLIPKHPTLKIFDTMKILVDATVREILA